METLASRKLQPKRVTSQMTFHKSRCRWGSTATKMLRGRARAREDFGRVADTSAQEESLLRRRCATVEEGNAQCSEQVEHDEQP